MFIFRPACFSGPPVEAECADGEVRFRKREAQELHRCLFASVSCFVLLLQDNRFYEEIRERGPPSRSPPVGVSSVYATVNGPQPGGGEGTSLYSIVTSPQNRVSRTVMSQTSVFDLHQISDTKIKGVKLKSSSCTFRAEKMFQGDKRLLRSLLDMYKHICCF